MSIGIISQGHTKQVMTSQTNRKQEKTDEKFASFLARQAHMQKLEEPEGEEDYHAFIQKRIEEMHEKIKNGDIEVRIQIGAQEFSEEEWDKLLERFDKTEEELREQMREEHEKRKEEAQEEELERKIQLSKESNI